MTDMPDRIFVDAGGKDTDWFTINHLREVNPDDVVIRYEWTEEYIRADKYAELKEQLMFFLEDWDHCTEMGFCPDLGYLEEEWCPWCKTRRLLGLPDAKNWEEHLENET